jgi:hypothetical protein
LINFKKEEMGLDTLNIELPGAGKNNEKAGAFKGIVPGNYIARINKFELWQQNWKPEENALFLVLKLETLKPSKDFEGYPIDENDPNGPKYDGLIGNVKSSTFAFKNGFNTRTNSDVDRDEEILKAILAFCIELDCVQWFRDAHGKYDTIQEWVDAFNADMPYKDKYLDFCIAGDEYINKEGKMRTTLYLPKPQKIDNQWQIPYKALTSQKPLLQFDEATHFKRAQNEPVEGFKADDTIVDVDIKPLDLDLEGFDIL